MDDLDDVTLGHLRQFLHVASSHAPSPTSGNALRDLERRLGASLFRTGPGGTFLTGDGAMFRENAERVLTELAEAAERARADQPTVRVGVCSGVVQELLTRVEKMLCEHGQPWPVSFRPVSSCNQKSELSRGTIDLGLLRLPIFDRGLTTAVVADEELGVVLGAQHPLAGAPSLRWADMRDQRLLWFDARRAPAYASGLLTELEADGWHPRCHVPDGDRYPAFVHDLVSNDDLVALRPASAVADDTRLVWIPVAEPGFPHERLALVTLPEGPHAGLVRALL
jgi:DNA-binding transcriptional LysR family regulator